MELYHDIAVLGVQQQATIWPGDVHDTAWQGHDIGNDTAGPRVGRVAGARQGPGHWELGRDTKLYHDRSEGLTGWGWVTIQSIIS